MYGLALTPALTLALTPLSLAVVYFTVEQLQWLSGVSHISNFLLVTHTDFVCKSVVTHYQPSW